LSYYAQGDYYRGDYYRGDPGLFSGIGRFFKRAGTIIAHGALGAITGGPIGAVVGLGRGAVDVASEVPVEAGGEATAYTPEMRAKHAEIVARGGGTGYLQRGGLAGPGAAGGGMAMVPFMPGMRVRRMHPNKSTYVTRGGGTSRWPVGLTVHAKGTEAVPSRRMNVVNPRALRRASRRIRGAVKILRRIIRDSAHVRGRGAVRSVRSKARRVR
jgi:hypothetical protein